MNHTIRYCVNGGHQCLEHFASVEEQEKRISELIKFYGSTVFIRRIGFLNTFVSFAYRIKNF